MCPEPALLVAYLDGTLFHRDASAVEDHVSGCASCTELLDAMRMRRAEEERAQRSRHWIRGAIAVAVLAVSALGLWMMRPASNSAATREVASANRDVTPAPPGPTAGAVDAAKPPAADETRPSAAADAKTAEPLRTTPSQTTQATPPRATPVSPPKQTRESTRAAAAAKTRTQPSKAEATKAETSKAKPTTTAPTVAPRAEAAATPPPIDAGGLVLRGRNRRNRSVMWRARDRTIERSTDAGATWMTEQTADRSIRAGAFVDANVAWVAGEGGLVLRRTKNGWFSASPPADGTITAVRASSPSKATVTFDDGRVFQTDNGGVTWSQP